MWVTMEPVVVGAFGTAPKGLGNIQEEKKSDKNT